MSRSLPHGASPFGDAGSENASVMMPAASAALAASVEGMAAAAGGRGVGVLDGEAAAHEVFLVVDLSALEVAQAHGVHDHLYAVRLEDLVPVRHLVQHHSVAETGAASALDVDPEAALREALLL